MAGYKLYTCNPNYRKMIIPITPKFFGNYFCILKEHHLVFVCISKMDVHF